MADLRGNVRNYWASMSAEERSAEMVRRMALARKKRMGMSAAGRKAISDAQRTRWRKAAQAKRERERGVASTESPFPSEVDNIPRPDSIKQRLETLELALAVLKRDIGF